MLTIAMITIPYNKPYITGNEQKYIAESLQSGKMSGDGPFTKKCTQFLEQKYGYNKVLLTTSCTHALEMASLLADIKEGDEVILPSYTFVSTANPFILRGAKLVFVDSMPNHPNMDASKIEGLITNKTKAIVPVHYAGVSCDMDTIMGIADKYNLVVIEDAAQGIHASANQIPLGKRGHMAAFSFHDTKNIICGEGGMLVINDKKLHKRAEIIREKGTNRSAFFRGEVDKYGWVDVGSSYLSSDILAAFLYAQLEKIDEIHSLRHKIWNQYQSAFAHLYASKKLVKPTDFAHCQHNAHIYFLLTNSLEERTNLVNHLRDNGIAAPFHYLSLHKSSYYHDKYTGPELPNSDFYTDCLVRLPLWPDMTSDQVQKVINEVLNFYE
ncbi:MAG: dTDP-4-amino-4,6-dideoxygalactose transaminase [Bacteroidota bacterium]|nr:dTDP-4-amino-4,6-dideoxygalactose transaminase [Bacteroidota bacterium]